MDGGFWHLFQSHNGAIAAQLFGGSEPLANLFQSHNGAIAASNCTAH